MSTENVTGLMNMDTGTTFTTEYITTPSIWYNGSEITLVTVQEEEIPITENVPNIIEVQPFYGDFFDTLTLFQGFIITEIIMTALELIISIVAAVKIQRWRRNYRNQMLMQLSLARFLKRMIYLFAYLKDNNLIAPSTGLDVTLDSCQFYMDSVIVILVFFFVKHMYDSLLLVLVKISQNNLYKVLAFAWLLPIPVIIICSAIIITDTLDYWTVYLLMCSIFRWPLILIGTTVYLIVLYRVLKDRIRKFARSLTVITFLLCLIINFYLFSRDIIELWCLKSFATILTSYVLGFLLNILILGLYIILITLNFKYKTKSSEHIANSFIMDNFY